MLFKLLTILSVVFAMFSPVKGDALHVASSLDAWQQQIDDALIASYDDSSQPFDRSLLVAPPEVQRALNAGGYAQPAASGGNG